MPPQPPRRVCFHPLVWSGHRHRFRRMVAFCDDAVTTARLLLEPSPLAYLQNPRKPNARKIGIFIPASWRAAELVKQRPFFMPPQWHAPRVATRARRNTDVQAVCWAGRTVGLATSRQPQRLSENADLLTQRLDLQTSGILRPSSAKTFCTLGRDSIVLKCRAQLSSNLPFRRTASQYST
jgi:hypothetical protein